MPLCSKLFYSHRIQNYILIPKFSTNLFIRFNQSNTLKPLITAKYKRGQLIRELNRRYEKLQNSKGKTNKLSKNRDLLPKIESIAAQKVLSFDKERVKLINERAQNVYKEELNRRKTQIKTEQEILPYKIEQNPKIFDNNETKLENSKKSTEDVLETDKSDVGFFVFDNKFCDDYSVATTADLPEDDMTEPKIAFYGNLSESVENIEFQLPSQDPIPKEKNLKDEEICEEGDWLNNYGTTNVNEEQLKNLKILDTKCESCGAQFHCHNPSLPGFVPLELLNEIEKNSKKTPFNQKTGYICRRCFLLKEYNFLLNINVCEIDYNKIMGHLKLLQEVLILLIVDLTDLNSSIIYDLPKIIGPKKPLIVVGNKVDLLPPDTKPGYLRHYQKCLKNGIEEAGISQNFNILKYMLISAKTGFGIEEMITNIYQNWIGPRGILRGDIYVIGSTNAGKSTLFNTLIQSDLCKVRAMDLVERVTTSICPGTTLSLLKFPLMNPTPQRIEMRRKRLIEFAAWRSKEEFVRKSFYEKTCDPKYAVLQGIVENTYKEREDNLQPLSSSKIIKQFNSEVDSASVEQLMNEGERKPNMTLNDRVFKKGFWCFDTPGTVNKQQILDLFTLKELINIIPRSIILPRVFILFPNESLLLGGVGRIDLLDVNSSAIKNWPIFLTVFASEHLKINVMKTKFVDRFLLKNRGNPTLGAPIGNTERLNKFPKLEFEEFTIKNEQYLEDEERGIADVVLSSLGWVLMTTKINLINIRAWTPSGRGLTVRQPPILPYAAAYRGKKIFGTSGFQTRKLAEIETFSHTQRSSRPKRIIGKNYEIDSSFEQPYRFVNFDIMDNIYFVPAIVLSIFSILFLWLFELSFALLLCSFVAFFVGFLICHFLIENPLYCFWLQRVFANIIGEEKNFERFIKEKETNNEPLFNPKIDEKVFDEETFKPWDELKLDENFNRELDDFFKTLVINYINNWYTEKISEDDSFTFEIRQLIKHSSAKILKTFLETDVLQILINDVIPIIIAHIERVISLIRQSPERSFSFEIQSVPLIEAKVLELWPSDLHYATLSQDNQLDYLRSLSDTLICKFVDDIRIGGCFVDEEHQQMLNREGAIPFTTKWSCHSSRHFLRELFLSTILIPTIDFCSDPDSLNYFVLSLLNKPSIDSLQTENVQSESTLQSTNFLNKFCEQTCTQSPDSLLCLKLSDLVRDQYLVKLFEIYIRDFNGPVKYLDCFLQTRDIHIKIQKCNLNEYNNNQTEQKTIIIPSEEFNEIKMATKQLYLNYIYSNNEKKNNLIFNKCLIEKFEDFYKNQKEESNNNCLKIIENLIEGVYQFLQYNYVIPFYQSENYLGFLCGAPPDVDELIRGVEESSDVKIPKVLDGSFSLSQFRKKLFNFIAPSKEVSTQNTPFYPSYSTSDLEGFEKDEMNLVDFEEIENNGGSTIVLSDMGRNLNKWTVTIKGIEQRGGGDGLVNPYFVFNIFVERNDLSEQSFNSNISLTNSEELNEEEEEEFIEKLLLKQWTIGHKYSEFYALEDKIRDYYGNSIRISGLPDRKTTLQLLRIGRNNRTLMESHLIYFERFLQQLIQQPLLKRSDLLNLFLTTEEDTSGYFSPMAEPNNLSIIGLNILSDLNPIRAMRKAAKERGQNLKPFILNLLANILAPPTTTTLRNSYNFSINSSRCSIQKQQSNYSHSPSLESKESFNLKRLVIEEEFNNGQEKRSLKKKQDEKEYVMITNVENKNMELKENNKILWKYKFNIKSNLYELCLYLFIKLEFIRLPIWIEAFLCSLRSIIGYLFSFIFNKKIEKILKEKLLNAETATYLVKSLHELILSWNTPSQCPTPSQISVASSAAALSLLQLDNNNKIQEENNRRKRLNTLSTSEQERLLRTELLLHRLEKKIEEELFPFSQLIINWFKLNNSKKNETTIRQLFFCFQMPTLNRQLIFVLLDIFVQKIFLNEGKKL